MVQFSSQEFENCLYVTVSQKSSHTPKSLEPKNKNKKQNTKGNSQTANLNTTKHSSNKQTTLLSLTHTELISSLRSDSTFIQGVF